MIIEKNHCIISNLENYCLNYSDFSHHAKGPSPGSLIDPCKEIWNMVSEQKVIAKNMNIL